MKILIVDDNENNRLILRLLLEDYAEDNNIDNYNISDAVDGLRALDMCRDNSYDLIFMDIMMPKMDGIEATKEIRKLDSKVMIIAVSAVDDGERKKTILSIGAEDYISKPINSEILIDRIANYSILIDSRRHKNINHNVMNLFTTKVYSRHTKFMLDSEDSLAEFWEFFLLNASIKSDYLSDVIRAVFEIVERQLKIANTNAIYIEESEDIQYFTLTNIEVLPKKVLELLLMKNNVLDGFIIEGNKLSIELFKDRQYVTESPQIIKKVIVAQKEQEVKEIEDVEVIASPLSFETSKSLEVFDYIEAEDLYDLEEYSGKLNSLMLVVGSGDISEEEVSDIYSFLEKLGSILSTYSEVYPISQALTALSLDMATHLDIFIANSEALGPMCKAFSNDMSKWIEQSFHTGAPSADFMNDTIVVNCQTISGMLKMDEVSTNDDFDDIFDF